MTCFHPANSLLFQLELFPDAVLQTDVHQTHHEKAFQVWKLSFRFRPVILPAIRKEQSRICGFYCAG